MCDFYFTVLHKTRLELCNEQVQMGHRLQSSAHMWHCSCLGQWDALFRFMTNKTQEELIIDCEILSINVVNIYPKLILRSVCDARRHSDHDYPRLHRSNYSDNYLLQWGKCVAVDTFEPFSSRSFMHLYLCILFKIINTFLVNTLFPMVPTPVIVVPWQPILTVIFRSEISRARRMKVMTKSMWICITR